MRRRTFLASLLPLAVAARRLGHAFPVRPAPRPANGLSLSMWIYLWDIVDEGYDTVFGRLKDHGLTSLSMASTYHAGKFLLPHNPRRKVLFPEDGTVYFTPSPERYGRMTPIVNSLVREGHDLARVRREADRSGLETRAWVVCCHNTPLGMLYPDTTVRTVFGDPLHHSLCPSHPDVREYLRSIVRDIAAQGPTTIELEAMNFMGYAHEFHHEREGIELTAAMRFLLSLCFCPHCTSRATQRGVDITSVAGYARKTLETFFASPDSARGLPVRVNDLPEEIFAAFHQWRSEVITTLAEELVASAHPHPCSLRPMVSIHAESRRAAGMDPGAIARVTGGLLTLAYLQDGKALQEPLAALRRAAGNASLTVGLQVGLPGSGGKSEFLSRFRAARGLGVTDFNFYNYGFIPLERLGWIREASQS